ncbi:hypothetical protein DL96DRAFT_1576429 [Flagelloscypha sp. PMI_526]|nr:hypothetical protein DL96DRAFT_1576429 [Flagelloscypha sp. PMI_526]
MNVYDQEDAIRLNTTTFLVAIVLLYYDYFLTIGDEVRLIWTRPKSLGSIVFFLNRYPALVLTFGTAFLQLRFSEGSSYQTLSIFHALAILFVQVIAGLTLAIRTIALYQRSRWVISLICGLIILCASASGWSIQPRHIPLDLTMEESYYLSIRRATGWESMLLFDCTTFTLLMLRSYFEARKYSTFSGIPLLNLLIRDGAIYFTVLAAVNTTNIIMYYFGGPYCDSTLATLASNISNTMICRLCLNLREHAADINCSANFHGAHATTMSANWRFRETSQGVTDETINNFERTRIGPNDREYV